MCVEGTYYRELSGSTSSNTRNGAVYNTRAKSVDELIW